MKLGGEGDTGMRAVASVIMNRVNASEGEYARVSQGGSIRNIIYQQGQFDCTRETINGQYNSQNIYNMTPTDPEYSIADWAIAGNKISEAGDCLRSFENDSLVYCELYSIKFITISANSNLVPLVSPNNRYMPNGYWQNNMR